MTIVTEDGGWIDDSLCACGEVPVCDCIGGKGRVILPENKDVEFTDRLMTDSNFYDRIVGW